MRIKDIYNVSFFGWGFFTSHHNFTCDLSNPIAFLSGLDLVEWSSKMKKEKITYKIEKQENMNRIRAVWSYEIGGMNEWTNETP